MVVVLYMTNSTNMHCKTLHSVCKYRISPVSYKDCFICHYQNFSAENQNLKSIRRKKTKIFDRFVCITWLRAICLNGGNTLANINIKYITKQFSCTANDLLHNVFVWVSDLFLTKYALTVNWCNHKHTSHRLINKINQLPLSSFSKHSWILKVTVSFEFLLTNLVLIIYLKNKSEDEIICLY